MAKPAIKMVKSAQRVMEVLEFFDGARREATVMDLVRVLDYPQSSASELLRCLVSLGYLHYDRYQRTYRPTPRVPLLGSWAFSSLFRNGSLLATMDRLTEQTGDTAVLATIDSFSIRYLHIVKRKTTVPEIAVGATHSPFRSALGRVIASRWSDKLIQDIVRRHNAEESEDARQLRTSEVVADLHNVAVMGYAVSPSEAESGCGMVAINLPGEVDLAVGISCSASAIRDADQRAELLVAAFSRQPRGSPDALRLMGTMNETGVSPLMRVQSAPHRLQSVVHEGRSA